MTSPEEETRETWAFNLHWANDYDLYLAVLDFAAFLLERVPGMTDQTLGRNLIDTVARWCADEEAAPLGWQEERYVIKPTILRMMREEVGDFRRVNEEAVAETVRDLLEEGI